MSLLNKSYKKYFSKLSTHFPPEFYFFSKLQSFRPSTLTSQICIFPLPPNIGSDQTLEHLPSSSSKEKLKGFFRISSSTLIMHNNTDTGTNIADHQGRRLQGWPPSEVLSASSSDLLPRNAHLSLLHSHTSAITPP